MTETGTRTLAARLRTAPADARAWWAGARTNRLFGMGLVVAALVVVLDQATKHWILFGLRLPARRHVDLSDAFDLSYVENTGVSFGLFAGGTASRVLLSVVSVVVTVWVVRWLGTLHRRVAGLGAGLIIGGALGNLYDRVLYGFVVDFLDFSGLYFPFVFNVADAAICTGVACLAWDTFVVVPRAERAKVTDSEAAPGFREDAAPGKGPDETVSGARP